jgi:hypothetical protein
MHRTDFVQLAQAGVKDGITLSDIHIIYFRTKVELYSLATFSAQDLSLFLPSSSH